jgi:phage pi2 protein 07
MLRAKEMNLQEWSRFQDVIDHASNQRDGEMPALLVRNFLGGEESLVLLAGEHLDKFEAASPGGWIDYPEADEDRWIYLAGDRSIITRLGLKLGAN